MTRRRPARRHPGRRFVERMVWRAAWRLARRRIIEAPLPARSAALLGGFFVAAGVNHFVMPRYYRRIVPPRFGDPATVVAVSGVAEVAGGLGVLVPSTRRLAGWWLIAVLVAIFPANVHMAVNAEEFEDLPLPRAALWLRLPLQPLMVWWAWRATRPPRSRR